MSFYWPKVTDSKTARKAANNAAGFAAFGSLATFVVILLNESDVTDNLLGLGRWDLSDVVALAAISWFIYRRVSRVAAVLGLVFWLGGQAMAINNAVETNEHYNGGLPALLFGLIYLSGVRGTFAYHSYESVAQRKADLTLKSTLAEVLRSLVKVHRWAWPKTSDHSSAKRASRQGVILAFIWVAISAPTLASTAGMGIRGVVILVLITAGALVYWQLSRLAALAELVLLVCFLGFVALKDPSGILNPLYALSLFLSVHAVRGTFAYWRHPTAGTATLVT